MSMASAIHAAMSGLAAVGRASDITSSNIANAMTPGHARREVALAANELGGVRVTGIIRHSDPVLVQTRRTADAAMEGARVEADFTAGLSRLLATTDGPRSLTAGLAALDAALVLAASGPESQARLDAVAARASELASAISGASRSLSDMRSAADNAIAADVDRLNTMLTQVRDLTQQIVATSVSGADTSAMIDQRQVLIDRINVIVPVREIPRDHGGLALYSQGGAILLDGSAAQIGFTPANTVTPGMTLAGGTLSGLSINGRDLPLLSGVNPLRGGTLSAHLAVRDDLAVAAQDELDALAQNLVDRFATPAVDPTLAPGQDGLFTFGAPPFTGPGLSERLQVNAIVDPAAGGQSWRLRDGINAAGPGPAGEADLLRAMTAALNAPLALPSGRLGGTALSAAGAVASLADWAGLQNDLAEQRSGFAEAAQAQAFEAELSLGVDTDTELSNLMRIEQAYAANARVLQTLDDMMEDLLRI